KPGTDSRDLATDGPGASCRRWEAPTGRGGVPGIDVDAWTQTANRCPIRGIASRCSIWTQVDVTPVAVLLPVVSKFTTWTQPRCKFADSRVASMRPDGF